MAPVTIQHRERAALDAEAQDWLVRLTSGQATTADSQAFKRWCGQSAAHADAMRRMTRVWEAAGPAGQALTRRMQSDLDRPARTASVFSGRRAFLGGALAAGAAYVVTRPPWQLWPGLSDMTADYHTGTGEQRQVVVSQAVVVDMNTQTSINLRRAVKGEGGAATLELLTGEAQLSLQSSGTTPFAVLAGGGRLVASTAAQFNVRATEADVYVTCMAGVIELTYDGHTAIANAAEQITYGNRAVAVRPVADPAAVTAWRDRVLVFNNVPLTTVVDEINRYRPGRIIVTDDALGRRLVQARVRLDQLADVVGLIRGGYGAQVTTLPAGIVLLS